MRTYYREWIDYVFDGYGEQEMRTRERYYIDENGKEVIIEEDRDYSGYL